MLYVTWDVMHGRTFTLRMLELWKNIKWSFSLTQWFFWYYMMIIRAWNLWFSKWWNMFCRCSWMNNLLCIEHFHNHNLTLKLFVKITWLCILFLHIYAHLCIINKCSLILNFITLRAMIKLHFKWAVIWKHITKIVRAK